jgi:LmbE family N-acetylglucosaminyl deacetylase
VLAHPDDESLATGGVIAKYARKGVNIQLICASRGERGRFFDHPDSPGPEVVGKTRNTELKAAAKILGINDVYSLDYMDGDIDRADPSEITLKIAEYISITKPDVVVTFGPDGAYGHPDHIAISQYTGAAITRAAVLGDHHLVQKFYFLAWPQKHWDQYIAAFKKLSSTVDNVVRESFPWPEWVITTRIDTSEVWETVWEAIQCHKSQLPGYPNLQNLTDQDHKELWGKQEFYRVFSLVNGGRQIETDLFEGLS